MPTADDRSADVPEHAEDAVRRALLAIEEAAEHGTPAPQRIVIPPPPPPPVDVTIPVAPATNGFAPPTADMHADAVYARAVEAKVWQDASAVGPTTTASGPAATGDGRRGALRRLIQSLRRTD